MSDVTDVELDYYRERIAELEAERDRARYELRQEEAAADLAKAKLEKLREEAKRYKDDRDQILSNLLDPPNLTGVLVSVLVSERDKLRAALDELETEIRRGDNDNGNVDTNHCLAVIDNVEPLK
jgi:chromosome segregation ATPase